MSDVYAEFVRGRLEAGEDPNDIAGSVEEALRPQAEAAGWALFGDGNYRRDTVCSICGSWCAGICGHENDPSRRVIPRAEYEAAKA